MPSSTLHDLQATAVELTSNETQLDAIDKRAERLNADFRCAESATLEKDCAVLSKKHQSVALKCTRTLENLQNALEALVEEASLDQQRWIAAAQEKVTWCADVAGDKYSIEAKLATVHDLLASVEQGQAKTETMTEKTQMLKTVTPTSRHQQLDRSVRQGQDAWKTFLEQLELTKYVLQCDVTSCDGL